MTLHSCITVSLLSAAILQLAACGSGGGGGGGASSPPPAQSSSGGTGSTPTSSTPSPAPAPNVIQIENAKTAAQGATADWLISDASYAAKQEIEGYASATSVNRGESINLYVNTVDPSYTINVYRIGWYGGLGGRLVAGPIQRTGVKQPAPVFDSITRMVEARWTQPYALKVPANTPDDWASGTYLARLTGSSGKQSYILFTVRDDARASNILFQNSVTTHHAYNNWGGYDFYDTQSNNSTAAVKISLNRPYRNPGRPLNGKGAGDFLDWELYTIRFLEREGYDVTYQTDIDTHIDGSSLLKHKAVLSVGHDEYWSKQIRDAFDGARDAGVNLGFFGADTGSWQIRVESSPLSGQANRTLVAYKYRYAQDPLFASRSPLTTYLWRDTSIVPINRPESALVGTASTYNSVDLDMVMNDCPAWICAGTGLGKGSVLKGMLGYEVNKVDASSPANVIVLADSPFFRCADTSCTSGTNDSAQTTYYTAPSGAGVFATGSMNWNWGLDTLAPHADRANADVQQITRNIFNKWVQH